ncbi:MAG: dimethylsulfoxide reductase subunit B [Anaerolineales bacterium]|nr:dimethylsulfoxide reductase subunit B [Anaerolineales bacterium]
MTYAFTFDASACTGCKACQIACKDKNNLPVGVLWRRVYEVSGGSWQRQGGAWATDVFAYNLTVACNHCVHPKCAGVCPTDAYVQREDGIVYIDESKCIGCGYCAWACPYTAPQYNPEAGHMSKCNFCMDNIDAGLPPSCVAACPMRALDFVEIREQEVESSDQLSVTNYQLWSLPASEHPFPLPNFSRTEPHLEIKPHKAMENSLEKAVSNREEIKPAKNKSELSLVAFTLLSQIAAGMAMLSFFSRPLSISLLIAIGGLISAGGLVSFLHLGTKKNAWRAVMHLQKSWFSREILMLGLFGGSWLVSLARPGMGKLPFALCGIGLVYSMAQVYRLRSVPAWDTNRTLLAFVISTILLGGLGLEVVDVCVAVPEVGEPHTALVVAIGLIVALLLALAERNHAYKKAGRLRLGLIGLGLIGVLGIYFTPDPVGRWIAIPVFLIILAEEAIGRWLFYEQPRQRLL